MSDEGNLGVLDELGGNPAVGWVESIADSLAHQRTPELLTWAREVLKFPEFFRNLNCGGANTNLSAFFAIGVVWPVWPPLEMTTYSPTRATPKALASLTSGVY